MSDPLDAPDDDEPKPESEEAPSRTERASEKLSKTASEASTQLRNYEWATATKTLLTLAVLLPVLPITAALSVLPPMWKVWHKITRWSSYQMQKAANADGLANVRRSNGHEDLLPAKYAEGAEDEKDRSGWKVKGLGDKRYDTAVHGRGTNRMGKANVLHINEDDPEQGSWAEAAIDNALQLNREQYLFRDATLMARNATLMTSDGKQGQAVADGGVQQRPIKVSDISIDRPGICEDVLVPLGSPDGYDGQVISWSQYQNVKQEQADQETVRDAKNQAWAAAKLDEVEGKDLLKWVLILGVWSAVLLFHQELGAAIVGLTGGGGGGGGGAVGTALGTVSMPLLGGI